VEEKASKTARWLVVTIVLCVLEGACRKWLVPGANHVVQAVFYFSKDAAMAMAAMAAFAERPRSSQVILLRQLLTVAAVLIALASMAAITGMAVIGGMLSIRGMIVVPLLALLIAPGLRSRRDLELIAKTIGYLAIGVAALGVLQFYLPGTNVLNRQFDSDSRVIVYHGRVRAAGTFSFISGMSAMALVACWSGCFLLTAPPRHKIGYVFVVAGLACAAAALSRSGMFFSLALLVFVLVLSRSGIWPAVVLGMVLAVVGLLLSGSSESEEEPGQQATVDIVHGTFSRHQEEGDSVEDRSSMMLGAVVHALTEFPVGNGLGTGQQAEGAAGSGSRSYRGYEPEPARIVFEIGVVGFLGVVLMRAATVLVLGMSLISPSEAHWHYLRKASVPAVLLFLATNTVFNHVACTFAWIIVAVALATFEIEARQAPAPPIRPRRGLQPTKGAP
jgi:hypothetical protein